MSFHVFLDRMIKVLHCPPYIPLPSQHLRARHLFGWRMDQFRWSLLHLMTCQVVLCSGHCAAEAKYPARQSNHCGARHAVCAMHARQVPPLVWTPCCRRSLLAGLLDEHARNLTAASGLLSILSLGSSLPSVRRVLRRVKRQSKQESTEPVHMSEVSVATC